MTRLTRKISKSGKIMVSGEIAQEWCKMPRHLFSDAHDSTNSKNFKVRKNHGFLGRLPRNGAKCLVIYLVTRMTRLTRKISKSGKIMVSGEIAQEWCKMPRHLFSDAHDSTNSKNFKVRKNHGFWGVCPGMVQNASSSI